MTAPVDAYRAEMAKRGLKMERATGCPVPSAETGQDETVSPQEGMSRAFSVYLSNLQRKKNRHPLRNATVGMRNKLWMEWYRTMTCEEIAEKWTKESGVACYGEKVRRTLRSKGVVLRPRGHRHAKNWTMRNRVAVLEQQMESLMSMMLGKEGAA